MDNKVIYPHLRHGVEELGRMASDWVPSDNNGIRGISELARHIELPRMIMVDALHSVFHGPYKDMVGIMVEKNGMRA